MGDDVKLPGGLGVYRNRYGHPPNMEQCRAQCAESMGIATNFYQCSRKGRIEERGYLWCGQHAPSAVEKRNKKNEERYQAKRRADDLKWALKDAHRDIAGTAIEYFQQKKTHNDLEAAVTKYLSLKDTE